MVIFKHSGVYSFRTTQLLPISLEEAWNFFSTPQNLQKLTPENLDFKITSPELGPVHQGQIITYGIKIVPLFRTNWVTEITHVEPLRMFVDEQRFGPYKLWHHKHTFEAREDGVLMTDEVHFKLPFSLVAPLAFRLFVQKKLTTIFTYRKEILHTLIQNNQLV